MSARPSKNLESVDGGSLVNTISTLPVTSTPLKSSHLNSGRGDAVAHEDGLAFEARIGALRLAVAHKVVAPLEVDALAPYGAAQGGVGLGLDADQRDLLVVGAVLARGFCSGQRELSGDVFRRKFAAALSRDRGLPADRWPGSGCARECARRKWRNPVPLGAQVRRKSAVNLMMPRIPSNRRGTITSNPIDLGMIDLVS